VAEGDADVVVAIFAAAETVTDSASEVDVAKFVSPEYEAVIECDPAASIEVLNVASPEFSEIAVLIVKAIRHCTAS